MKSAILGIDGMTCSSCSGTVENTIRSLPGLSLVIVTLSTNTATFDYDEAEISLAKVCDEIESVGFGAEILQNNVKLSGDVESCSDEHVKSSSNEQNENPNKDILLLLDPIVGRNDSNRNKLDSLKALLSEIESTDGVLSASMTISQDKNSKDQITLRYDDSMTGPRDFVTMAYLRYFDCTVTSLGGFMMANRLLKTQANETQRLWNQLALASILTIPILTITMILPMIPHTYNILNYEFLPGLAVNGASLFLLSTPVQFYVGNQFHTKAWKSLKAGTLGMDFLVSTGTMAAYIYSVAGLIAGVVDGAARGRDVMYFETSAVLITAVLLGKYLETYAKGQTAEAIHKLSKMKAQSARLVRSGTGDKNKSDNIMNGCMNEAEQQFRAMIQQQQQGKDNSLTGAGEFIDGAFDSDGIELSHNIGSNSYNKRTQVNKNGFIALKNFDDDAIHTDSEDNLTTSPINKHYNKNSSSTNNNTLSSTAAAVIDEDMVIDAALLHRNDVIRLVSGEVVPADGVLLAGSRLGLDEAMMTGESAVVSKKERDVVFGGTTVVEGSALMQVTACGDHSTLGRIISTVQEAQAAKPPIQELADRVAQYFVPFIALTSGVTFVTWMVAYYAGVVPASWYSSAGSPYLFAFFFALAVWVSACPCAFGLATPTAVLVATGVAAKHGILVRRGAALQFASNVNAAAFDKTGTLTKGSTEVTDFLYCEQNADCLVPLTVDVIAATQLKSGSNSNNNDTLSLGEYNTAKHLLQLILFAECRSSHPLAKGITSYCRNNLAALNDQSFTALYADTTSSSDDDNTTGCYKLPREEELLFEVIPGLGIHMYQQQQTPLSTSSTNINKLKQTTTTSMQVLVGSGKLLQSYGVVIPPSVLTAASSYRAGGKVAVYMALNGVLRAMLGVSDAVRPEAAFVIAALHRKGIQCYMITGDEPATAQAIAKAVGIPGHRVLARAKPDDKKAFIEQLQGISSSGDSGKKNKRVVVFIGDGTNDSPALAVADVGLTMASGSDIAVEAGDMVLCKNDLHAVLTALDLSCKTMRRIKINYFWALGYNALLIPIAAGVLYPSYHFALAPMLAGAAMALSSVSIVLSSLLLMRYTAPRHKDNHTLTNNSATTTVNSSSNGNQCGCPASSAPIIETKHTGLLWKLWQLLTGNGDDEYTDNEAAVYSQLPLLLNNNQAGDDEAYDLSHSETNKKSRLFIGSERADRILYNTLGDDNNGNNNMHRQDRYSVDSRSSSEITDVEHGDSFDDVELDHKNDNSITTTAIANKARNRKSKLVAIDNGCGCGKGNCQCGGSCQCGAAVTKIYLDSNNNSKQ